MAVTAPPTNTPHGVTTAESPGLKGFLDPIDYEALVKCVHCGLCLNECPTYRVNGLEPDRAPVIVGGLIVLAEVMAHFGLPEVETSEADILDGIALMAGRIALDDDITELPEPHGRTVC